jgi:hypothetical protein
MSVFLFLLRHSSTPPMPPTVRTATYHGNDGYNLVVFIKYAYLSGRLEAVTTLTFVMQCPGTKCDKLSAARPGCIAYMYA